MKRGASAVVLDGGGELWCPLVNGGSFRVLLELGWGKDEVSKLRIGGEWREERPSLALAVVAASSHDSDAEARAPVVLQRLART
jgi:hypothetical protein